MDLNKRKKANNKVRCNFHLYNYDISLHECIDNVNKYVYVKVYKCTLHVNIRIN